MASNMFKPIHQPHRMFNDTDSSRSSSVLSSTMDNDRETPIDNDYSSNNNNNNINGSIINNNNNNADKLRDKYRRQRAAAESCNCIESNNVTADPKFLLRRSSSAMRVRELREVLSNMTSSTTESPEKDEVKVSGSQNARLLVASQQRLISRLQDLRNELDSMDNEVARVRADIMNSRRYFSAMTGNPCGPDWPQNRWGTMDNTFSISPNMSFLSLPRSSDASPYNSDDSASTRINNADAGATCTSSPFQSLQHFEDASGGDKFGLQLSRSDSCSSFLSWRSDVELAGVFPEEPIPLHVSPQKPFSHHSKSLQCQCP